jgi:multiple sugar transport system substrate-binding protein
MSLRQGLLIGLLFFLTACQPAPKLPTATPSLQSTGTPSPTLTSTPDAGTRLGVKKEALKGVTIQVWTPWFGVESNLFNSQVQQFNQTNEWGIVVQSTSQINYSQLYQNTTAAFPTAKRPQLVIAFPEYALEWDAGGFVTNLNDYINDPQYGLTSGDVNDFAPVFWSQDSFGGRRVAIPAERSARFLLYDVTWAHDLGFGSPPRTADEFRLQACRAHQAMLSDSDKTNDALGGWLVDTNPIASLSQLNNDHPLDWANLINDSNTTTALSWMMAFGGGVLEGNDYRFLTPKNIAAFSFVKKLYEDGCAWTAQPNTDLQADFASRKALFATGGLEELTAFARAMATAGNSDQWTVLSFPGDIQTGLVIYGSSYVIINSTPEQQLASWLFVRWLLTPANQAVWVNTTGLFPLRTSSLAVLGDYGKSHPQWEAAVALLPQAQIQPQLASWRKVRVMLGDGFDSMFRLNIPSGQVASILAQMESTSRDLSK